MRHFNNKITHTHTHTHIITYMHTHKYCFMYSYTTEKHAANLFHKCSTYNQFT